MAAPIYPIIKEKILEEIRNMQENTPIASERELASRYEASRMTVRNAVNELVEEGFLYRDKNRGTFVADRKLVKKNTSTEGMQKKQDEDYTIIYFCVKPADEEAVHLEISPEDMIIRIVRLNQKDGKAQSMEELCYSWKLVGDEDANRLEVLLDLNRYIEAGSITQKFIPMMVPVKYLNLLHVKLNTPIIMVESTIMNKSGQPVVYIREYNNPEEKVIEITT